MEQFAEDGYEIADLFDVTEVVEEKMLIEALRKAVAGLPEDEQRIIAVAFQGKTEREAAQEAGLPRNTFIYRRDKIVGKLKNILRNF